MADVITLDGIEEIKNLLNTKTNTKIDAVKSVVDTINSNVNTINSNVATNNTASETGILSQKLSWLITVNKNHGSVERTSAGSQNWTCPTGVYYVYVIACGGQGGGGGGGGAYYGNFVHGYYWRKAGGGGSGAVSEIVSALIPVTPGTVYAITVGAGGSAGTAGAKGSGSSMTAGGAGGNGGDTKFGSIFTVLGGGGGGGGAKATWGSSSISAASAAAAGSVRTNNASTFRQILLNIIGAAAGKDGVAPPAVVTENVNFGSDGEGTAGGAKVTNRLGLSSGAGGAGGKNGYPNGNADGGTNGSAGGAGSAGYIKVIW